MRICRYLGLAFLMVYIMACHYIPDTTDSHDNPIYLSDYQNKWVIVNYWATWCKSCLIELPELNAFQAQYIDKLIVLGVNFDGLPNADIQHFANQLHITFPMLSSFPSKKFGIDEISSLPMTLIINPQGKLSATLYGPQTQNSLFNATLKTGNNSGTF